MVHRVAGLRLPYPPHPPLTLFSPSPYPQSSEEEDDECEDDEGEDDDASSSFFPFTGQHAGGSTHGVFTFGERAAQAGSGAAADMRSAAASGLSGSSKSVLSDAERAKLLDALARSRRDLEQEISKKNFGADGSASRDQVPSPSGAAFEHANAPCPGTHKRSHESRGASSSVQEVDAAWAAAMRRHAERSQSSASSAAAFEKPGSAGDASSKPAGAAAPAATADACDSAMTVAVRTAEEAKERGNERFRLQRWEAAAREYSSAVQLSRLPRFQRPDLAAVYLSNRAACYIRLERYEEAVEDCEAALELNSKFWKAGARAGKALMMLGEFDRALAHLERAEAEACAKFEETPTARRMVDEVKKVRQLVEARDTERALSCIKSIIVETPNAFPLQMLHLQVWIQMCDSEREMIDPVMIQARDWHAYNTGTLPRSVVI